MSDANDLLMAGGDKPDPPPVKPMTPLGEEIANRLKEIFFAYDNRNSEDNRSAQTTLGPSEIGTPCERRLAMSLLRIAPVNPGGDGWAAFVGTQIHRGLAEMLVWSSGTTGRHAVEQELRYPSAHVPKGTADWIDRTVYLLGDHKGMGANSLLHLKRYGPSQTYRVQGHTYGYGATLRGEQIEHIAVVGWPREAATLRGLYVWTEPYDEQVALDALARVDRIAEEAHARSVFAPAANVAATFPIDPSACTYCPFHLKNARHLQHGCNGQQ